VQKDKSNFQSLDTVKGAYSSAQ